MHVCVCVRKSVYVRTTVCVREGVGMDSGGEGARARMGVHVCVEGSGGGGGARVCVSMCV